MVVIPVLHRTDRLDATPSVASTDRLPNPLAGARYFRAQYFNAQYFAANLFNGSGSPVGGTSTDRVTGIVGPAVFI